MAADWSETSLARLRFAWEAGFTAQEIAEQFGDGRTRNSIIGKAHALGLPSRKPVYGAGQVVPRHSRTTGRAGQRIKEDTQAGLLGGKGYRKAYASRGDDPRARFVRVAHSAENPRKRRVNKTRLPGFESVFIQQGRTKFSKAVSAPNEHILVSGHNNIKIGKVVRKGSLRGYWIYTLSLEERKTCPISCQHWQSCYGNNMPFAKRVDHTHPDFLTHLENAVDKLCAKAEKRGSGILVRLHALGDFYSIAYVRFWTAMLQRHKNLAIYGYTAHPPASEMGKAITKYFQGQSAMIRFSNGKMASMSTVSIGSAESCPPDAFICPEQTAKTLGCDTCGLCWGTRKNVAFLEH